MLKCNLMAMSTENPVIQNSKYYWIKSFLWSLIIKSYKYTGVVTVCICTSYYMYMPSIQEIIFHSLKQSFVLSMMSRALFKFRSLSAELYRRNFCLNLYSLEFGYFVCIISKWTCTKILQLISLESKLSPPQGSPMWT